MLRINFGTAVLIRNDIPVGGQYGFDGNLCLFANFYPLPYYEEEEGKCVKLNKMTCEYNWEERRPDLTPSSVLYKSDCFVEGQQYHWYANELIDFLTCYDIPYQNSIKNFFVGGAKVKDRGARKEEPYLERPGKKLKF